MGEIVNDPPRQPVVEGIATADAEKAVANA
jgi:hypothetical protein